jgi:hypothetical protein
MEKRVLGVARGQSRGQAAIEYMMIISIVMIIMIPLLYLVNSYMTQGKDELKVRALEDSVDSLAEASEMVYYQGYPAKMTINFYVPEGVTITNVTEDLIRVRVRTSNGDMDVVTRTQANLTGGLPTNSGNYKLNIVAEESGVVNVTW